MLKDLMLPGEEFKDMEGCKGYAISDMGRVYSYKSKKILKPQVAGCYGAFPGCEFVNIRKGKENVNVYIHLQVAITFLPNEKKQREVLHINGNKRDNSIENLKWSGKEYTEKELKKGIATYRGGENAPKCNNGKEVICTTYNIEFASMAEASFVCDIDPYLIKSVCKKEGTYLGLSFKFKEKKAKQIRCVQLDMVFDSFEEAAEYVNGKADRIEMCCKGKAKTHQKYRWEYVK